MEKKRPQRLFFVYMRCIYHFFCVILRDFLVYYENCYYWIW